MLVNTSCVPKKKKDFQNSNKTKPHLLEKLHLDLAGGKSSVSKDQEHRCRKGLETDTHRKQGFASID